MSGPGSTGGSTATFRPRGVAVGLALGFLAAAGAGWAIGSLTAPGAKADVPTPAAAEAASGADDGSVTSIEVPVAQAVLSEVEDRIVVQPAVVDPTSDLPADTVTELVPDDDGGPSQVRVVPAEELEATPVGTVPADVEPQPVPDSGVVARLPSPEPVDPDAPDDPERVRMTPDPPLPGGPAPGRPGEAPVDPDPAPEPPAGEAEGGTEDPAGADEAPGTDPAGIDEEGHLVDEVGDPIDEGPLRPPLLIDLCATEDAGEHCGAGIGAVVAFGGGDDDGFPGITAPIGIDDVPRPGRPDVRLVELAERSYRLVVPRQEHERSELWVIPREPDQETSACDRASDLAAAGHAGMLAPSGRSVRRVVVGEDRDALGDYTMSDFYEFQLATSGVYDVCLTWYEDLAPARNVVERESWTLIPEGRKRVQIHYGRVDLEPPRDRVLTQPQALRELVLTFTDSAGRELCYSGLVGLGPESSVVCEFDVAESRELISVAVTPRLYADDGGTRSDPPSVHALPIGAGGNPCFDGSEAECKYFALPIAGALDGDGPWTIGTAHLMVTYEDPDARAAVSERQWVRTGSFAGEDEDPSVDPDAPRLDLTATRVAYYPTADPFRAWVHWKADRPVAGAVVRAEVEGTPCHRGGAPTGNLRSDFTNTDSGVAIVAVCPGSDHDVSITFEADDGERITFSPEAPTGTDVRHHYWWGGSYRTERIDLPLQVAMRVRWRVGSSYWSHVRWYATLNDELVFSENRHTDFFGTRPSCGKVEEFDIAADRATPAPVTRRVGATLQARLDVSLDLGQSRNLVGQCMSAPTHSGGEVVIANLPVEALVRNGRIVTAREFEVISPSGDRHIYEVTYTVSTPYVYDPPAREPGT